MLLKFLLTCDNLINLYRETKGIMCHKGKLNLHSINTGILYIKLDFLSDLTLVILILVTKVINSISL